MAHRLESAALRAGVTFALAVVIAGCGGSPTAPVEEVFRLVEIDGLPLPRPLPGVLPSDDVEVMGGTLILRPDGTFTESKSIRCNNEASIGRVCPETGEGYVTSSGTYSRSGSYLEYDGGFEESKLRRDATFATSQVTVHVIAPPMFGHDAPPTTLLYRK